MSDDLQSGPGDAEASKQTQFQKGQSGNRRGRPKRKPRFDASLAEELKTVVPIVENGKRKRLPKYVILMRTAVNLGMNGDFRGLQSLFKLRTAMDAAIRKPIGKEARRSLSNADIAKMSLEELHAEWKKLIDNSEPLPPEDD